MKTDKKVIRQLILKSVTEHPKDMVKVVTKKLGISRQGVNRHVQSLIREGILSGKGKTKGIEYSLKPIATKNLEFTITQSLEEDRIWRDEIAPNLIDLPPNVREIAQYGFMEIVSNAIHHSEGEKIYIGLRKTFAQINISIRDDGTGIFHKIKEGTGFEDLWQAAFELSKGRLTTDETGHTGMNIFFTSRIFDKFGIMSGGLCLIHKSDDTWVLEEGKTPPSGTYVGMVLNTNSEKTVKELYDKYALPGEDAGFLRTHIPLAIARYGDEQLISRSQAKRVLRRIDQFKEIIMDFKEISFIGQAFADEIFRVFQERNPEIKLHYVNAQDTIERIIQSVLK